MIQAAQNDIHLPVRWAVLEQALRELQTEEHAPDSEPAQDDEDENDDQPVGDVRRDRDAEDTRSRNQPVRPGSGHVADAGNGPRGGTQ